MKRFGLLVGVVVLPLGLMTYACDDTQTTGSGGATSGSTTAKSTTGAMVTTSTKASSSSGTPDCTGLGEGFGDPCGPCLETNCCAELVVDGGTGMDPDLVACAQASCDAECFPPPTAPFPIECTVPTPSPSVGACVTLDAKNTCNPVTNEGCTAAGAACDGNGDGFECFPDMNTHAICDMCGSASSDGNYCQPGMTCVAQCAKYCCDDGDCGTGKCTKTIDSMPIFPTATGLGICEDTMTTTTTAATTVAASSSSTGP